MYCYKCGCELGNSDYCPNCGADVRVYKKIIYNSNRMYNDGLEKAQVRDMSGAIKSLKQALWFNKDNLDARNLLGLVYYEIGETVEALSQWVISENINHDRLKRKDNPGARYLQEVQNNRQETENIRMSIHRYNHAIECCYSNNLDVAMLELKKVLSLNPHYLRARQLLALLYIQRKEYRQAERELRKCLRLDINNTTSLRYLKEVETHLSSEVSPERIRRRGNRPATVNAGANGPAAPAGARRQSNGTVKYTDNNETIIQPVTGKAPGVDGFSAPGWIMGGIIGLIVGAALVAFLVMPARVQSVRQQSNDTIRTVSAQLDTKDSTISDLQDQLNTLKAQQASDSSDSAAASSSEKADDSTRSANDDGLFETANAYINDPSDNDTLTDTFVNVDPDTALDGASQGFRDLYNNLYSKLQSPMLERYAWAGINLYEGDNPDYEEVIKDLVIANKYEDQDNLSMTYVERLYYLADSYNKAYAALSDEDKKTSDYEDQAKKYATLVVSDYSDSDYVSQCEQLLTDLGVDVSTIERKTTTGNTTNTTAADNTSTNNTNNSTNTTNNSRTTNTQTTTQNSRNTQNNTTGTNNNTAQNNGANTNNAANNAAANNAANNAANTNQAADNTANAADNNAAAQQPADNTQQAADNAGAQAADNTQDDAAAEAAAAAQQQAAEEAAAQAAAQAAAAQAAQEAAAQQAAQEAAAQAAAAQQQAADQAAQ